MEAFLACFSEASGRDLTDFFTWYEQAGTPELCVSRTYDSATETVTVRLEQSSKPTPGQQVKSPLPLPIRIGMMDAQGGSLTTRHDGVAADDHLVILTDHSTEVLFEGVTAPPVLSVLRGFSAPVKLTSDATARDGYVLMAADPDLFNRWEAGQTLARQLVLDRAEGRADDLGEERFADAWGRALMDETTDHAFRALMLTLPTEADLALAGQGSVDPDAIHESRERLRSRIAAHLASQLRALHTGLQAIGPFSPDALQAGRRALRNAALDLIAALPDADANLRAVGHFEAASNMTDLMGGLAALTAIGGEAYDKALAQFYDRWRSEPLVIDKWFAVQARSPMADTLDRVMDLTRHSDFDSRNPNRLRALVSGFSVGNPYRFHARNGSGYDFLADQVITVDAQNPSVAARLIEPLSGWGRYEHHRSRLMQQALNRILSHPGLSKNVQEVASRAIGA